MDVSSDNTSEEFRRHLPREEVKTYKPTQVHQPLNGTAEKDEEEYVEGIDVRDLTEEDAESLVGVSINRAATHRGSTNSKGSGTAGGNVELEGVPFVDSDEDALPLPGKEDMAPENLSAPGSDTISSKTPIVDSLMDSRLQPSQTNELKLPEPWRAGPSRMVIQRPEETRAALRDIQSTKRRSLSGSGEVLRRLLPSMPKAGSFMQSLPSAPFFGNGNKSRNKAMERNSSLSSGIVTPVVGVTRMTSSHQMQLASTLDRDRTSDFNYLTTQPPLVRVISDSLLYASLSRSSSLGDDSRFENQREMVNSRLKAIKDSLQDRSSFRLPAMPSISAMPSIPNFDFNFGSYFGNGPSTRSRTGSVDSAKGMSSKDPKKRQSFMKDPSKPVAEDAPLPDRNNLSVFDRAIANLTGDIVIMGGYRGSILRSAKPPNRQLWVPVKVGLNIRKVNIEVGLEDEDEERMEESIFASGMLQNIGPVDISRRLFKRLRETEYAKNGTLRIWDYGYDWRLSPHLLSRKLKNFLEGLPCNKPGQETGALIIAHSLGGLITRHVVNQRPELVSGVIYAGVPQSCINILGPIRLGDSVLLSSRVLSAQVNFTLRTSFVLLPLDGFGFIDKATKEPYHVNFFNANDWVKYRFSPCTDPPLPPKNLYTSPIRSSFLPSSLSGLPLPGRKATSPPPRTNENLATVGQKHDSMTAKPTSNLVAVEDALEPHMGTKPPGLSSVDTTAQSSYTTSQSVSTTVTLPRPAVIAYLERILPRIRKFKLELAHLASLEAENRYPPLAVIYGKSIPTVYAAKVDGRDGIACADAYDNLAFASGDGVCLAKDAQLPEGYRYVFGGRVASERGHVTLLGDLEAVGRALEAVCRGKEMGIGRGREKG